MSLLGWVAAPAATAGVASEGEAPGRVVPVSWRTFVEAVEVPGVRPLRRVAGRRVTEGRARPVVVVAVVVAAVAVVVAAVAVVVAAVAVVAIAAVGVDHAGPHPVDQAGVPVHVARRDPRSRVGQGGAGRR